ncbi:MAG: SufS family cysteine desulfurase [Cytophagia bacterium]|nr:SufS family cysteine desulfurase [Cytophagia bacterium]
MNIKSIKSEFPIFRQKTPAGTDLIYLDSASSTQKPQSVIDSITEFYSSHYANTGRASYWPATESTRQVEQVRKNVQQFIGAKSETEVVFTSGTTDSINKLANSIFNSDLWKGRQIIVSEMEHHANLVPWQIEAERHGLNLVAIPLLDSGELDLVAYKELLEKPTALVAITAISNVLGTINDVNKICRLAKAVGAITFVDAAQLAPYAGVNVEYLCCDFLSFSGHKLYGPTGIGVLYGKQDLLNQLPPFAFGGGMITEVDIEGSSFRDSPFRHEAGTLNIAGIIGLGAAIDFVEEVGFETIQSHEDELTIDLLNRLADIEGLKILGEQDRRGPLISFTIDGLHPHDLSTYLNESGICVRAGHHCAQPLMKKYQIPASTRVSFGVYNDMNDVEQFIKALKGAYEFFL